MGSRINYLINKPHLIFLIDAFGALLTAFLIGYGLVSLQPYTGLSVHTLYLLSGIATSLALYSFVCYFFIKRNVPQYLNILSALNFTYCVLTSIILVTRAEISWLSIIYFSLEIIVILALVTIERTLAQKISKHHE